DGEVRDAVAVEVARGEGEAELVAGLGDADDVRRVLAPEGVAGGDAARMTVVGAHGAGVRRAAHVEPDGADGEVVAAVAVEVARGEGVAEGVEGDGVPVPGEAPGPHLV